MQITVSDNVKYLLVGEGEGTAIVIIDDSIQDDIAKAYIEHLMNECRSISENEAVQRIKAGMSLSFTPKSFELVIAES